MKLDSRSICIVRTSPTFVKKFARAPIFFFTEILCKGIVPGNLLDEHIITNIYLCPALVRDRGPTQSTITLIKGYSTVNMGETEWLEYFV